MGLSLLMTRTYAILNHTSHSGSNRCFCLDCQYISRIRRYSGSNGRIFQKLSHQLVHNTTQIFHHYQFLIELCLHRIRTEELRLQSHHFQIGETKYLIRLMAAICQFRDPIRWKLCKQPYFHVFRTEPRRGSLKVLNEKECSGRWLPPTELFKSRAIGMKACLDE